MRIEVVPYDPAWPDQFKREAQEIKEILGDNCINVFHMGSTSVAGLAAKPIIDMIPVVKDILAVDKTKLEAHGYIWRGEFGMMFRRHCYRYRPLGNVHAHIWELGHPEIEKHLLFAQHLRDNAEDLKAYEDLKLKLAEEHADDRTAYSLKKDDLVQDILRKTGFKGRLIVEALLDREWAAYHKLLNEKTHNSSPAYKHFVLSLGVDIIGAAQIELKEDKTAEIRALAIDTPYQHQGHGTYFLEQIKRWISSQGLRVQDS